MKGKTISFRCPVDLYNRAISKAESSDQSVTDYMISCIAADLGDNRVVPVTKIIPTLGELSTNINKVYQSSGNDDNVKAVMKGVNDLWQLLR